MAERENELRLVLDDATQLDLNFRHSRPKVQEQIQLILGNRVARRNLSEPDTRTLFDAVKRISALAPEQQPTAKQALRQLYESCLDKKVKFLSGARPSIECPSYRSCTYGEALAAIATFSKDWIRPLSQWKFKTHNKRRQFDSLVDHLLGVHPVPRFLSNQWFQSDFELGLKNQAVFIHVAAGHSIRRLELPITFSKRMSHFFMRAPEWLGFRQAIRWSQIRGMGGSEDFAKLVVLTSLGNEFTNDSFWRSVFRWFIERPMFDAQLFPMIYDFINYQKFGTGTLPRIDIGPDGQSLQQNVTPDCPNFSIKGRTPQSLMREVARWHLRLHRLDPSSVRQNWVHSGFREFKMTDPECSAVASACDLKKDSDQDSPQTVPPVSSSPPFWTIQQLLSARDVVTEGAEMKHCVASYVSSCSRLRTSIWTMRKHTNGQTHRVLTIEVKLRERRIAQIRGKNNRSPTRRELQIVRQWAQLANLKLKSFI